MSTFDEYLAKILSSVKGEEVRKSIYDALLNIYNYAHDIIVDSEALKKATEDAAKAAASAKEAEGYAEEAKQAAGSVSGGITYPHNLFVNGDFQINQRGKTSYTSNGFTLDMWKATNVKVEILSGKIKLSNTSGQTGYFQQTLSGLVSGYYTMLVKAGNVSGTVKGSAGLADFNITNGEMKWTGNGAPTVGKITLANGASVELEYAALYPGNDNSIRHQKEEYTSELNRCRQYLLCGNLTGYGVMSKWQQPNTAYIPIPIPFKKLPTVKSIAIAGGGTITGSAIYLWDKTGEDVIPVNISSLTPAVVEGNVLSCGIVLQEAPGSSKAGAGILEVDGIELSCEE